MTSSTQRFRPGALAAAITLALSACGGSNSYITDEEICHWAESKAGSDLDCDADATIKPAENVYQQVDPEEIIPLPPQAHIDNYDIRLNWDF